MKRVGIIQPNYIPWRGYFDFVHRVDTFVFLDDVQYTKRDWRNRNKVRTGSGDLKWLSVPVKASRDSLIKDVEIDYSTGWGQKHLDTLKHSYGKTPFFEEYFEPLEEVLMSKMTLLSDLDIALCKLICRWLGVETELRKSSELGGLGKKDHRLIQLVQKLNGTHYLSGPAAKAYIQPGLWQEKGIGLSFMEYPDYPEYPQIAEPFESAVSVLDLLFMTGPKAPDFIWGNLSERKT